MFVLGIPGATLHRYLGSPESIVAVAMDGSKGMSGLVSGLLRSFWKDFRARPDAAQAPRILNAAFDLMAGAYSSVPQAVVLRSSPAAAHRTRIMSYIEAHLADPDLTPTAIAFDHGFNSPTHFGRAFRARFGVTPREFRRSPGPQVGGLV